MALPDVPAPSPASTGKGPLAAASNAALAFLRQSMGDALHQLSMPELRAVTALVRFGPATTPELAAPLNRSVDTTRSLTTQLVREHFIVRSPHPEDHRRSILTATPARARMVATVTAIRRDAIRYVAAALPSTDRAALGYLFTFLAHDPDAPMPVPEVELTWCDHASAPDPGQQTTPTTYR